MDMGQNRRIEKQREGEDLGGRQEWMWFKMEELRKIGDGDGWGGRQGWIWVKMGK
jgi:hypothetical protein